MAVNRDDWIVIGISGVTCGGKTTLAERLARALAPVELFHQDKYFLPDDDPRHVPALGTDEPHHNYDILTALDMDNMYSDVMSTLAGRSRAQRRATDRGGGRVSAPHKQFLVVEGFTVLNYPPINDLCDLRYYFVLEYGQCRARRALRLYEPPDVAGYFEGCVWPEYLRHRTEIEKDNRVKFIDGTRTDSLEIVMADLRALGASETE